MTWLNEMKNKFDKEDAVKKARDEAEKHKWEEFRVSASKHLKQYVDNTLADLEGKKTKDGKVLRLEFLESSNGIKVYAGDEEFLYLHFGYVEEEEYDSDGCRWGNGKYYLCKNVIYYRPHKSRSGYDQETKSRSLYDEDLAHYLLTFVDI